jgi:uncharacterized protein (DUF1501 family)
MKRRDFLKTVPVGFLPIVLNGFPVKAISKTPFLNLLAQNAASNGRVLVVIQLNGGNDGLNTLIPIDQYSNLYNARQNVIIPENKILKLTGTDKTGFHPEMKGMREMYDNGLISVVQDTGYPDPDFSHFRSTDIWMSASGSDKTLNSGWLGRWVENEHPDFPDKYPNAENPDPLAIQIGFGVSLSIIGNHGPAGLALSDPNYIYQMVSGTTDPAPNTPAGHELTYIRLVAQQTQAYSISIKNAADKANNISTLYPENNSLSDQLKIVARLIAGGLKTPLYMVSIGGFDTHASQVDPNDTTKGMHSNLLKMLSEAIFAFQDDVNKLGISDKVSGMTYSEFGRRIRSNASTGTDHGAAAPMFVFGKSVNPGIIGSNPNIPQNTTFNDNVPLQYDFRQVYRTVLGDWFGATENDIQNKLLYDDFEQLPIFKAGISSTKEIKHVTEIALGQNYPNPFQSNTQIKFYSPGGQVSIRLFDNKGRFIKNIVSGNFPKGNHEINFEGAALPSGNYYYQMLTSQGNISRTMVKK